MQQVDVVDVTDREQIAQFCRRRPAVHAYLLGDLDDFFWPHTRWFGLEEGGELLELALLYTEPETPVVQAFAETGTAILAQLLRTISVSLPTPLYAHVTSECLPQLAADRAVVTAAPHHKLALDALNTPPGGPEVVVLGPEALDEVEAFYAVAYPGGWFRARMLETRRYVGVREGGALAAVAGVHVYSPEWRVATLGNVATLPRARGRGLAQQVCARLCDLLLGDGIETIGLNVRGDNEAALAVYRALGFIEVSRYVEAELGPTGHS